MLNNKFKNSHFILNEHMFYIGIFFIITLLYLPSLSFDFVWDDYGNLVNNPYIKSLKNILSFFTNGKTSASNIEAQIYRPIRNLLFYFEWNLFEDNPFFYKIINISIHACNAIILYFFSIRFLKFSNITAVFTALFFGIHPVTTEVVCPVKGVEDIICVFFGFLCIIQLKYFLKFEKKKNAIFSLLFYFLSIFSKESGLFLFFIILIEVFSVNKYKILKNRVFFYVIIIITFCYFILRTISLASIGQAEYLEGSLFKTLFLMSDIFIGYLKVIFFPLNQIINYMGYEPFLENSFLKTPILGWIIILAIIFPFIKAKFTRKYCLYFILSFLPISNIIPMMQWGAERFLYFPLMFISLIVGIILEKYCQKINKIIVVICLLAYISVLSVLTYNRQKIWTNNAKLGKEMIRVNPYSYQGLHLMLTYYKKNHMYNDIIILLKPLINKPFKESAVYEYLAYAYINTKNENEALNIINLGLKKFPNSKLLLSFRVFLSNKGFTQ